MSRKLAMTVHVPNGDGEMVAYRAGTTPPAAVAQKITNPSAWEPEEVAVDDDGAPTPPPQGGAGSGRDAWATYAEALGVQVHPEATRDEIVELLAAKDHPVA